MVQGRFNHNIFPGARFGMLTIIQRLPKSPKRNGKGFDFKVLCRCDCGKETTPSTNSVSMGLTKSCGCMQYKKICERSRARAIESNGHIVAGTKFGRLTVIERIEVDGKLLDKVRCQCSCGNYTVSNLGGLVNKTTRSCGCLASQLLTERNKKSAKYGRFPITHPNEHASWLSMIRRCTKPGSNGYDKYGKVGVTVCNYLRKDPRNLYEVLGDKPDKKHSLDRFPIHNGHYSCGTCSDCKNNNWVKNIRWASSKEQMINRGAYNNWIEAFGKKLTISQWVELSGLSWSTLQGRIKRGWSVEKALSTPNKLGKCYRF